jgi:hypothetical protein
MFVKMSDNKYFDRVALLILSFPGAGALDHFTWMWFNLNGSGSDLASDVRLPFHTPCAACPALVHLAKLWVIEGEGWVPKWKEADHAQQ